MPSTVLTAIEQARAAFEQGAWLSLSCREKAEIVYHAIQSAEFDHARTWAGQKRHQAMPQEHSPA